MKRNQRLNSLLAGICLLALFGCSSGGSDVSAISVSGQHQPNWLALHWIQYRSTLVNGKSPCSECHGLDLQGGIAKVSCFTASWNGMACHAGALGHPAGFETAGAHGTSAAMVAPSASSGFAYCTICHGRNYSNGPARSCLSCHVNAPHPDRPWHGTTVSGTNHVLTHPGNAPECAKCHTNGNNFGTPLGTPAPAGTPPGCFNNTLCHGQNVGHPTGWRDPASPNFHGITVKAAVSGSSGLDYCRLCHGTDFRSGSSGVSCFSASRNGFGCHATSPHAKPWLSSAGATVRVHSTTDQTNALACGRCHAGGQKLSNVATPPANAGCFNGTLCHTNNVQPPHIVGVAYLAASAHGPDARANLGSCQSCHAIPATGGNPRYNLPKNNMPSGCETCHRQFTAHPTPWLPGRIGTPGNVANTTSHTTAGNLATACALCHGSGLAGGANAPSCMSASVTGIICHTGNPATNPTGCTSCHGMALTSGKHGQHLPLAQVTCAGCHNNLGPGTTSHANGTADTAISLTYQAKSGGTALFTAGVSTCTNVSCHGGQTTPPWTSTGSINVDADCHLCHQLGTTQYNSYNSGAHDKHVNGVGLACSTCHNVANLRSNHFTRLDTQVMEGPAAATVGGGATQVTSYDAVSRSCAPSATGFCHGARGW